MGEHSSENYLDQLLNSMHGEDTQEPQAEAPEEATPEEAFVRDLFGEPERGEKKTAKNEEDFLREFEEELLKDDIPDYTESLLQENRQERAKKIDASLDEMLDHLPQADGETYTAPQPEVSAESLIPPQDDDFEVNTLDEAVGAFDEELPKTEDGELDLSGLSDSNLMDMLSGENGLSDLGDLLSSEEEGKPLDAAEQEIDSFAAEQMRESEAASQPPLTEEAPEDTKGKKGRKKGKKEKGEKEPNGFLAKLSRIIFGEDDEDETVSIGAAAGAGADALSAENEKILSELSGEEKEAGKKKKEKKPKKEKPKKEKKPKEKKAKPPKPKKEKKPKPVDNTPPLPKKPVIAIVIMVGSLFALVLLMTQYIGYQVNFDQAQSLYEEGNYVDAFQKLQGLTVKEADAEQYNKLATLAAVSEKYQAYLVFDNYGSKAEALDALICAYGRYSINQANAAAYGCENEMEQLAGKIIKALLSDYDMTGEDAMTLYNETDRDDYTLKLHEKLQQLGLE